MKTEYHFIAIGGIGMSALAQILLEKGCMVSGSDQQGSPITDRLEKAGAKIFIGYDPKNLPIEPAMIIYSTAVADGNSELTAAKEKGFVLCHRSELLAKLMQGKKSLLVAGTHGKTTTSSLLVHTLSSCGYAPSYAVGGVLHNTEKNGGEGKGDYFIAEACESDGTFLLYPGYGAIVTNIDGDHLDYWKTQTALSSGFAKFLENISSKEHLLYCYDDESLRSLIPRGVSYGFHEDAEARILSCVHDGWTQRYTLLFRGKKMEDLQIPLIGDHNVLNSAAVFILGLQLGMREEEMRNAFLLFKGIGRRVEKKGECRGIAIYDDYGHHPTEIRTTLAGLRNAIGNKRLIAVFQPHRFTRTRDCLEEFPNAFSCADVVVLTDVYGAKEAPIPGIDAALVCEKIRAVHADRCYYVPKELLKEQLLATLKEGDVVLTIGAGDITKIGPELLASL